MRRGARLPPARPPAARTLAALAALAALLLAGCATAPTAPDPGAGGSANPRLSVSRSGAHAPAKPTPAIPTPTTPHPGAHAPARSLPHPSVPPHRRWGLDAPLAAAPQLPDRSSAPRAAAPGLLPVVDRVPTRDKVVFLTYDDGAERDPRFVDMVRELRLPVSMFLTDSVVGPGYGHFARLRAVGATVQNHTLDHTALRGLPYAGQRAEICGQQNKLKQRFGVRPTLFRPPYGVHDTTTLRAAADCGLSAVVLWRASMQIHDLRYAVGDRLRPGDIVLAGFRGPDQLQGTTLTEMTTRLLRRVQEQGLTVGRLEDYL
ncbi:polysaccharide deacetylase family protein [Streptomyces sp. SP17KL33]|uniref:polysaccharide deacetylase family protein n=1 Tax=Streptomyces sp. SP17KL33 TaxID=3002534 RepID=UPI002E78ACDB|nr:polysaccharide deacetylase family protein [Streptomyces sp. SP17KL33]MEE1833808.1 polysaccharide deacetylase family protein [Streptomyces sp. SP17KL33]